MPLRVIIVGAGIGGLCTAVALQQAGHSVQVFEKSRFIGNVGAALLLTPNGERVLSALGFDFERAQADEMTCWEIWDGITLSTIGRTDLSNAREEYGATLHTIHRADLHRELLCLTSHLDVKLGSKVITVDPTLGVIQLEDGSKLGADLIIGADGVNSVLRNAIVGVEHSAGARPSGMNAFRFMINTSDLEQDEHFHKLKTIKGRGSSVFADTASQTERHLVWYDCQRGQLQNFVGIHSTLKDREQSEDLKALLNKEFGHFHPSLVHIINAAPEVTDWPLLLYEPLSSWHRGKVVLIGDACHPMLPFGGQGANQAIEDAGALGAILRDVDSAADIPASLQRFEEVRRLRASRVQILSKTRLGKEWEVEDELRLFVDTSEVAVPRSFSERCQHDFAFDVYSKCEELKAASATQRS
ncbi:putative salicylate hydroxylase [Xylariaceae sp. FL1651]|nr:putative salicylate hydroxylase [Xylariaceae sp. FL1651]